MEKVKLGNKYNIVESINLLEKMKAVVTNTTYSTNLEALSLFLSVLLLFTISALSLLPFLYYSTSPKNGNDIVWPRSMLACK